MALIQPQPAVFTRPGKGAGRGKLAKLVEISLGQPEQPMLPANHLLTAHKGRISGSQVKEYGLIKKL